MIFYEIYFKRKSLFQLKIKHSIMLLSLSWSEGAGKGENVGNGSIFIDDRLSPTVTFTPTPTFNQSAANNSDENFNLS